MDESEKSPDEQKQVIKRRVTSKEANWRGTIFGMPVWLKTPQM